MKQAYDFIETPVRSVLHGDHRFIDFAVDGVPGTFLGTKRL